MEIKVAKLYSDALLPSRKHPTDSGLDLYFYREGNLGVIIKPGDIYIAKTGVTVEIPKGFFGWITNKSRNDFLIGGGIVDESFQGQLLVKIMNVTNKEIFIESDQAIAQLLIIPVEIPNILESPLREIHKIQTERGEDGGICSQLEMKI
jgi:dUTP pyrophosphatase